jgi:hypothetical protein
MEPKRELTTRRFALHMVFLTGVVLLLGATMGLAFAKAPGREPEVRELLAYVAWISLTGMLGALLFVVWGVIRFWRTRRLDRVLVDELSD